VNSSIFLQFKREIADPLRIEDFTLDDNRPMILAKRQGTALGITGRKKLAFIFTQATPEKAFRSFAALFRDRRGGAEYVLTGPQSLSQFEQVSTIGRVLGRSLHIEEISPDEARRELLTIGPLVAVNMLLRAWAAAIGQPAHVSSTVEEITGSPAHTFLEWATDHAAAFRP
jgi:hypothetical protein